MSPWFWCHISYLLSVFTIQKVSCHFRSFHAPPALLCVPAIHITRPCTLVCPTSLSLAVYCIYRPIFIHSTEMNLQTFWCLGVQRTWWTCYLSNSHITWGSKERFTQPDNLACQLNDALKLTTNPSSAGRDHSSGEESDDDQMKFI